MRTFQPMRLARRPEPFDHTDFIYEINKFDGFRALACIDCCEHKSRDGEVLNHSLWRRQGNSARRVWGSDSELDLQHSRAAVVYERVELTAKLAMPAGTPQSDDRSPWERRDEFRPLCSPGFTGSEVIFRLESYERHRSLKAIDQRRPANGGSVRRCCWFRTPRSYHALAEVPRWDLCYAAAFVSAIPTAPPVPQGLQP